MQVPPEFLKCVAFLCTNRRNTYRPEATTFFVNVKYQNGMSHHLYAVTAKHVITSIQAEGIEKVSFRLNFSDKPLDYLESSLADWQFHPTDPAADIAVLPVELPDGSDHLIYIHQLWSSIHGVTRKRELFRAVRKQITSKQAAVDLVKKLGEDAHIYAALRNPDHPSWLYFTRPCFVRNSASASLITFGFSMNRK
jgi:hypothetical protein